MAVENEIVLSVVVKIVGGQASLRRCLRCLAAQVVDRPIEVIVSYDASITGIEECLHDFPQFTFLSMGVVRTNVFPGSRAVAHELYDRRAAAGLAAAQGEVLALLEDTAIPASDWCHQVIEAHRLPYGVIGGAVEQGGHGALNWAAYFQDFGRYQLPLQEGPTSSLTDINVSYKRDALESIRELWAERYNEAVVHGALAKDGVMLWLRPQIVVRQDRGQLSFLDLVLERFWWGRLYGSTRVGQFPPMMRPLYVILSPAIPIVLLGRMASKVVRGRRNRAQFVRSFPYTVVMTLFWCLGELVGHITGRESPLRTRAMKQSGR